MAAGSIKSVTIRTDGWSADVVIEGFASGCTYAYGNPLLNTAKFALTVTSPSYNSSGNAGTVQRTVYGTLSLRKPYPNQATKDEAVANGDLTVRVALDDYVYSGDTNAYATIAAGWATNTAGAGQTSLAANALACTNNSSQGYAKAILRWATVPLRRITAPTFTLDAIAIHRAGQNAKPVACVEFTVTDGTTTRVQRATEMTKVQAANSGLYYCVYRSPAFTAADFADNATITCNVKAYPWVGDATSVNDSSGTAFPSLELCALPLFNDPDDDYGVAVAYVDSTSRIATSSDVSGLVAHETITQATSGATAKVNYTATGYAYVSEITGDPTANDNWTGGTSSVTFTPTSTPTAMGSDTSGVAADIANAATASASPCATIGGAATKIKAFNNNGANRSPARNNCDAAIIYLKKGRHLTTSIANIVTANTWCTITRAAGLSEGDARIVKTGASTYGSYNIRFYDLDIITEDAASANIINCPGTSTVSFLDSSRIGSTVLNTAGNPPVTVGKATYAVGNRFSKLAGALSLPVLVVDNTFTDCSVAMMSRCALGNLADNCTNTCAASEDNLIIAFNKSVHTNGQVMSKTTPALTTGLAEVCNLWESMTAVCNVLYADGSTLAANHVVRWHNTVAGGRSNIGYNDVGGSPVLRANFQERYNSFEWLPTKHDIFATNGSNVLGWSVCFGVGNEGNNSEIWNYPSEWWGWNSTFTTPPGYTDDKGGAGQAGYGDYHPTSSSTLRSRVPAGRAVIPYDLDGNAYRNDGYGTAGAYQYQGEPALNTSPSLSITSSPASYSLGSHHDITATATDSEDGSLTASIAWTSDIQAGTLATGGILDAAVLDVGTHTLTARVTDSGGLSASATVQVVIDAAPVAACTPPNITQANAGQTSYTFDVTYTITGGVLSGASTGNITVSKSGINITVSAYTPIGSTATTLSIRYTISIPGGWNETHNGTWTVAIGASPVVNGTAPAAFAVNPTFTVNVDLTAPAIPSVPTVAPGDKQVVVSWAANSDSDLGGYILYRDGVQVYAGTATTYTDTGLTNGTAYSYTLAAYDNKTLRNASAASSVVMALPRSLGLLINDYTSNFDSATVGAAPAGWACSDSAILVSTAQYLSSGRSLYLPAGTYATCNTAATGTVAQRTLAAVRVNASGYCMVFVREQSTWNTNYHIRLIPGTGLSLYRRYNATNAQLGTTLGGASTFALNAWYKVTLEAAGSGAAVEVRIKIQRASDSFYLQTDGTWGATNKWAVDYFDTQSNRITSLGKGGVYGFSSTYLDDFAIESDSGLTSLAAPANFTGVAGDGQLSVSWSAVPGAQKYSLSCQPAGGSVTTLDVGNVTSYTVTSLVNATAYSLTLVAQAGDLTSPAAGPINVSPRDMQVPAKPALTIDTTGLYLVATFNEPIAGTGGLSFSRNNGSSYTTVANGVVASNKLSICWPIAQVYRNATGFLANYNAVSGTIADLAGNALGGFSAEPVTNGSTVDVPPPPVTPQYLSVASGRRNLSGSFTPSPTATQHVVWVVHKD